MNINGNVNANIFYWDFDGYLKYSMEGKSYNFLSKIVYFNETYDVKDPMRRFGKNEIK